MPGGPERASDGRSAETSARRRPGTLAGMSAPPHSPSAPGRLRRVGTVLAMLAAAQLLAGLAVHALAAPTPMPLAVLAVAASLVSWPVAAWTLRPRGTDGVTAADLLTCLRHLGAGALATSAALVLAGALEERSWPLAILLAATIGTDALDGPVARCAGTAGPVGGRIDMEADAVLFLVLSVLTAPVVGPWVLLIGLMRYLYVAAMQVRPALRRPLAFSQSRRLIGGGQGVALGIAMLPAVPVPLAQAVVGLALALLLFSFGRDVVHLERAHRADVG